MHGLRLRRQPGLTVPWQHFDQRRRAYGNSGDLEDGESGIATQVHGTDKLPFREGQGVGWCDENARNARTALEMAPVVTLIRRVPVHWRFRVCEHVQMIGLTGVFQTLS
jgi:hypothetical protein